MSKQDKVELARTLCACGSPINKSQRARALGIARSSLDVQCKRPKADKALAVRMKQRMRKTRPWAIANWRQWWEPGRSVAGECCRTMAWQPGATARSRGTLARHPRLRPRSFARKRSRG